MSEEREMMKAASILFSVAALVAGLVAAWKWYKASKVPLDLGYIDPNTTEQTTYRRGGLELVRQPESGDPEMQRVNEIAAMWEAVNEGSRLSKEAAIWTAVSVLAGGVASLAGAFSNT